MTRYNCRRSYEADRIARDMHEREPRPFDLTMQQEERACQICGRLVQMIHQQKYCTACSMKPKSQRKKSQTRENTSYNNIKRTPRGGDAMSKRKIFTPLGASNHTDGERPKDDFYATDPRAAELLLEVEKFNRNIWECACGEGHLSKVFKKAGYEVRSSDIIDRGYGDDK